MITVASLYLYPVKSLRGFAVETAELDSLGLAGDRRFLVVDESGRFLTQRTLPRMALISTALTGGMLQLSSAGQGSIDVPTTPDPNAALRSVSVWSHHDLAAEDCGPDAASWLTQNLGTPCRLVRIGPAFHRPVKGPAGPEPDQVSFADSAPLLVATTASLAELNRRITTTGGAPVPMDRFRPNLVLEGLEPFAEDHWTTLETAGLRFRTDGPCERCIVTTADQRTGERKSKEPLKTLAAFRRNPTHPSAVLFGVNLINESKSGTLRTGDVVRVNF